MNNFVTRVAPMNRDNAGLWVTIASRFVTNSSVARFGVCRKNIDDLSCFSFRAAAQRR
jgi:hypothetical protein